MLNKNSGKDGHDLLPPTTPKVDLPASLLVTQFDKTGLYILLKIVPQSAEFEAVVPERLVLYAASNVDHEDLADAFHTKLKEDEGMRVLGGGTLEINHETKVAKFSCGSDVFGPGDASVTRYILELSLGGYKIED